MPSDNMSRPTSDAYREGWDRTFGSRKSAPTFASQRPGETFEEWLARVEREAFESERRREP
jgi:hypothetical protein